MPRGETTVDESKPTWRHHVDYDVLVYTYSGAPTFESLKQYSRETIQHATTSGFGKVLSDLTGLDASPGAVERLLETRPEWIGRFSLLQIAAPSRARSSRSSTIELRWRAASSTACRRSRRAGSASPWPSRCDRLTITA